MKFTTTFLAVVLAVSTSALPLFEVPPDIQAREENGFDYKAKEKREENGFDYEHEENGVDYKREENGFDY